MFKSIATLALALAVSANEYHYDDDQGYEQEEDHYDDGYAQDTYGYQPVQ